MDHQIILPQKPEMAAYAAVVSLQHTINALLLVTSSSSREILESAYEEASSLLQALETLNGSSRSRSSMERVDALEAQIRDSTHKLEDVLEFYELRQLEEEEGDEEGEMRQEICSFGEAAKRLEKEYMAELSRDDDDDEDTATCSSSETDLGEAMIGRSSLFENVLQEVLQRMRPDDRYICAFLGEQGSGSRVVAKAFYESACEAGRFERSGWASIGRGYQLKDVLIILIAQVEADVDDELLDDASNDQLSKYLYKALADRCYLIVLDGVEDVELLNYFRTTSFPDQSNGSVVLVTTNSPEVFRSSDVGSNFVLADTFEEEFWLAIHHAILSLEPIPAELEVAGREIVHNCRCLHISLAKTVVFLSKSDKTVEQWSKIAADKENPIFRVVDEISESNEIKKEMQCCKTGAASLALQLVGLSLQVERVQRGIYPERFFSKMQIISFFGMVGIGKTTFARNIFNILRDRSTLNRFKYQAWIPVDVFKGDSTSNRFDHRVWVHIGARYQSKKILIDILAQIYPHIPILRMNGDEKLVRDKYPIRDVSFCWMTCIVKIPYNT